MKKRNKSICILLLGLGIYSLTKLYKKYKKSKIKESEKYFSAGKYEEYIAILKNKKIEKEQLINFVYACRMVFDYQLLLEKSEDFYKLGFSDHLLVKLCKFRIFAGVEILKEGYIFKEIILLSVLQECDFFESEILILNEFYRNKEKEITKIDLETFGSLLNTFPQLHKEFKSHPTAELIYKKDLQSLIKITETGPFFRFLSALINFTKFNDIKYLLNLKDEHFFYSKMFYEYVISKQKPFTPTFFQKENSSSCFYKAIIYRNQSNKKEYMYWLNRAFNYNDCEFIYIELIKEKICQNNFDKALMICEKAIKVFPTDTLLLLQLKILISFKEQNKAKEIIKLIKKKESEFYFVSSFLEKRLTNLNISFSLNQNSFLTNFNLGLVLFNENKIECLEHFKNCLNFSIDENIYYKIFCLIVYLEEIKNLIFYFNDKKEKFFIFLKKRFQFDYLIFI